MGARAYFILGLFREVRMPSVLNKLEKGLCALFLFFLILSFNAPVIASMIVLCLVVHELGHSLAFSILGHRRHTIKIGVRGLLMPYRGVLSYRDEIFVSSAGPLINLVSALLCILLLPLGRSFFLCFAILHLLYATSNLLPLPANDGEKILGAALALRFGEAVRLRTLRLLSFILRSLFLFASLFFMLLLNAAYHLFIVFFIPWLSMLGNGLKSDKI